MTWIRALTCYCVGKPWEHYAPWKRTVRKNSVSLRQLLQTQSLAASRVSRGGGCPGGWTIHWIALVGSECTDLLPFPIQRHKTTSLQPEAKPTFHSLNFLWVSGDKPDSPPWVEWLLVAAWAPASLLVRLTLWLSIFKNWQFDPKIYVKMEVWRPK